jgi:hypothetical protein
VYRRILEGLETYLERHGLDDIGAVVGTLELPGGGRR